MSLRNKFLIVLSLTLLVISGSFVYVTMQLVSNQWVVSKERSDLGFAREEAREISQWVSDQVQKAYLVSDRLGYQKSDGEAVFPEALRQIESQEKQSGERVYFLVYSREGYVEYSSLAGVSAMDSVGLEVRKLFGDLKRVRFLSSATRDFRAAKVGRYIIISVPLVKSDGSFSGTLNEIVDFESSAFARSLQDFTDNANGYMEITGSLKGIGSNGSINLEPNMTGSYRSSRVEVTDSGAFEKRNRELITYAKISMTPWYVMVDQPVTELDAELRHLRDNYAWMFGIGLVLIFAVSYIISNSMARPLKELLKAVHRAANREFVKVEVKSSGEMKQLIDSFNGMTMSLERKYGQIDALNEFGSSVIIDIRESNIFNRISKSAASALDTEMATVMMPDETGTLRVRGPFGMLQSGIAYFEEGPKDGPCMIAYKDGRSVAANKGDRSADSGSGTITDVGLKNLMAAPIIVDGEAIGVLAVSNTRDGSDFTPEDMKLLETFANQAGIAIQNSHLYARLSVDLERIQTLQNELIQSEKLSAVGQLVSGVAHELNNPLGVILGFSQIARSNAGNQNISRYLKRIEESAVRASEIVRNLLTFARKEAPSRTVLNLNEAIDSVLDLISHPLSVNMISVVRDQERDSLETFANFQQLQQVFLNLFTNAMQALEGIGNAVITVKTYREGERLIAIVSDNGPGIAPAIIGKIFDPFFTTKTVGKGTGLGLSVTYSILKSFGGEIRVESEYGKGAAFIVELPAVTKEAQQIEEPEPDPSRLQGVRVLFVEDEEEMRFMVKEALGDYGCIVTSAGDGADALDKVESSEYDVIISDLRMPRMGGEEFYRRLTSRDPRYSRRFIFSSGDTARETTREFLARSECQVIMKPFTVRQLVSEILRVLSGERDKV